MRTSAAGRATHATRTSAARLCYVVYANKADPTEERQPPTELDEKTPDKLMSTVKVHPSPPGRVTNTGSANTGYCDRTNGATKDQANVKGYSGTFTTGHTLRLIIMDIMKYLVVSRCIRCCIAPSLITISINLALIDHALVTLQRWKGMKIKMTIGGRDAQPWPSAGLPA